MERKNDIESILNSTKGIEKVIPNANLFSRIEYRIQSIQEVSNTTLWLVAASILVLITINIGVVVKSRVNSQDQTITSLASTLTKSNQLYQ